MTSTTATTTNPHDATSRRPKAREARRARKVALAGLAVGAAGIATLGLAPAANAQQGASVTISPGSTVCVQQYASYQVRGDGSSNRPVKFSLKKNGVTISPVPANTYWAQEFRSSWGTFPGPGVYQACAFNNGTQNATIQIQLRTDYEF